LTAARAATPTAAAPASTPASPPTRSLVIVTGPTCGFAEARRGGPPDASERSEAPDARVAAELVPVRFLGVVAACLLLRREDALPACLLLRREDALAACLLSRREDALAAFEPLRLLEAAELLVLLLWLATIPFLRLGTA
jgi:hypothetical protein